MLVRNAEALQDFVFTEDGKNLLVAYRRASNILKIEENKYNSSYEAYPVPELFQQDEERNLHNALEEVWSGIDLALAQENFVGEMAAMARLRAPVDAFFDKVTVNAEEQDLRENRLKLLSQIRATLNRAADFSQIEG